MKFDYHFSTRAVEYFGAEYLLVIVAISASTARFADQHVGSHGLRTCIEPQSRRGLDKGEADIRNYLCFDEQLMESVVCAMIGSGKILHPPYHVYDTMPSQFQNSTRKYESS